MSFWFKDEPKGAARPVSGSVWSNAHATAPFATAANSIVTTTTYKQPSSSFSFSSALPQSRGNSHNNSRSNFNSVYERHAEIDSYYGDVAVTKARHVQERKRLGGDNVVRRAIEEDKYAAMTYELKKNQQQDHMSEWRSRHDEAVEVGQRKRYQSQMKDELAEANSELKTLRRARLKALLQADYDQQKRELEAKGLTIFYDAP